MEDSDQNSDDELPMISVHSLSQNSSTVLAAMPSAEEVAAERERERQLEAELVRLSATEEAAPARCESSGSEGEAALAAAVRALQVVPGEGAAAERRRAAAAAARLLAALPAAAALAPCIAALQDDKPLIQRYLTEKITHGLSNILVKGDAFSEEDTISITGTMCAVCLAAPSARGRRVLHRALLLTSEGAALTLAALIAAAVRQEYREAEGAARALQRLSDAARAGAAPPAPAPAPARTLPALLVAHAVRLLFLPADDWSPPAPAEEDAGAWRRALSGGGGGGGLSARARLLALRLAARGPPALRAALAAPAAPAAPADRHSADRHKVAVAASTLQLLFRSSDEPTQLMFRSPESSQSR